MSLPRSQLVKTAASSWVAVGENLWALAGQLIVSGASFLTTVWIGRHGSKAELCIFGLGMSVVLTLISVQEALISMPFVFFANRREQPRAFLGSSLVGLAALSLLGAAGVLAGAAIGGPSSLLPEGLAPVLCIIALTLPFHLLKLFVRRVFFTSFALRRAFWFDLASAAIQFALLLTAWRAGWVSGMTGHLAIGVSSMVVALAWLWRDWATFDLQPRLVREHLRQNWLFARFGFAAQVLWILHINIVVWSLTALHGKTVAGEFTACLQTMLLANPFVLGFLNVLSPRAARSYEQGGNRALRKVVATNLALMAGGVAVLWLGLALAGGVAIEWVFGGDYSGQQMVVTLLGASMLAETACKAPEHGLQAIEKPWLAAGVNVVRLIVTVAAIGLSVPRHGLLGAAASLAIADTVGATLFLLLFWRETSVRLARVRAPEQLGSML